MVSVEISDVDAPSFRQQALLDAAISVFTRFGYRKTSMDEIARAAGISRQGLYLQFANKEVLYRKAVSHGLNSQLTAAIHILSDRALSLETRLVRACSEWSGRHVGALGTDAADLLCAMSSLAGPTYLQYEGQFECALAKAISDSPLHAHCSALGLSPADAARALHATARGLKYSCKSRDEFVRNISIATRLFMSGRADCRDDPMDGVARSPATE